MSRRVFMILIACVIAIITTSLSCTLTLPFETLTDGVPRGGPTPTSRYPLDETTGTTAHDVAGPNPGIVMAEDASAFPKWIPNGRRGGALDFGLDGWVTIPNLSGARFPQRATLVMWLRVRAYFSNDETQLLEASEEDDFAPFILIITASNITFESSSRDQAPSYSITPSVPLNTWVLIAIGWDIPAGQTVLFARPDGEQPFPLQPGRLPPNFVTKAPELLFYTENGAIDDVRIFDRILSVEELTALD